MDQSKSNNTNDDTENNTGAEAVIPKRTFTLEFWVGLFTLVGLACAAYLAIGLGGVRIHSLDSYIVYAEFDNISGLKHGAAVEIAGVKVGDVVNIGLEDATAVVALQLNRGTQLRDDDIASIRTKGIIGDRYVKISRGSSDEYIPSGARMFETESVVDMEDIIGKIVHSLGSSESRGQGDYE